MKKIMTFSTLVLLSAGVYHASEAGYIPPLRVYFPPPYEYDGPKDDNYWTDSQYNHIVLSYTTLGLLARYRDVIGVGTVSNCEDGRFSVTVDHAVLGCTNGAVVVVHDSHIGLTRGNNRDANDYKPANNQRIVFAVGSNISDHYTRMRWHLPLNPIQPFDSSRRYQLSYLNRSAWPVERDDGVLFTQFTNIIQAVRVDHNWTNYFHLVRDGLTSTSNRVREDSYWDMGILAFWGTPEQRAIILADPLVDPVFKTLINTPGWGAPELEEP